MTNITSLLCGLDSYGDRLRYRRAGDGPRRPVVVWNSTRTCNLSCMHCYSSSSNSAYPGELSTGEAAEMIRDLAAFAVPVLLFSGGEPLMRKDLFELAALAGGLGLRTVLSTNGTLIDKEAAKRIRDAGLDYVGVSLDGIGAGNDRFRGKAGAFDAALAGIRNLKKLDRKVGLRLTLTRHNYPDLERVFELVEAEGIDRACFYHLVYSGRAAGMKDDDLSHRETRRCLDRICQWAVSLHGRGLDKEVLTVDNHADNVYVYLNAKRTSPEREEEILNLARFNGGNASGVGIANIDNTGSVYPDQFWHTVSLGNIRARRFGEIWLDASNEFAAQFRERKDRLKGRCARCVHLGLCNGNSRARAQAVYGDVWQEDPACYLTEEEITACPGGER